MLDRLLMWLVATLALIMFMVSAIVETLVILVSPVSYLRAPRVSVGLIRQRVYQMLASSIRGLIAGSVFYDATMSDSALYSSGRRHASISA